jgi:hypothetical protein
MRARQNHAGRQAIHAPGRDTHTWVASDIEKCVLGIISNTRCNSKASGAHGGIGCAAGGVVGIVRELLE